MKRACANPFAPSMTAASYCSVSMPAIAARVDDRAPAHALPDVGSDQNTAKQPRIAQEQPALATQQGDDVVDHSVGGMQHLTDDPAQDDPRHEVREIGDTLHQLLEAHVVHGVQQQRQQDRRRESEGDAIGADDERVLQHAQEEIAAEQPLEVLQADPRTAHDAVHHPVVLEGDEGAVHGPVVEQDEEDHRRQQQQIAMPVAVQLPLQPRPGGGSPSRRVRRAGGQVHQPLAGLRCAHGPRCVAPARASGPPPHP